MRAHNMFVPGNWSDPVIILRGKCLPSLIVGGLTPLHVFVSMIACLCMTIKINVLSLNSFSVAICIVMKILCGKTNCSMNLPTFSNWLVPLYRSS